MYYGEKSFPPTPRYLEHRERREASEIDRARQTRVGKDTFLLKKSALCETAVSRASDRECRLTPTVKRP